MNELHDDLLTQALESYPQAPLPPGFMRRVMAQIEPAPLPRFRLQFVDLAVPAFASLLLVTLILLAAQTDWLPLLLGEKRPFFPSSPPSNPPPPSPPSSWPSLASWPCWSSSAGGCGATPFHGLNKSPKNLYFQPIT